MVKDLISKYVPAAAVYGVLVGSSNMLRNQIAKIPGVSETASNLEELVASSIDKLDFSLLGPNTLVNIGELALGAGLLLAYGSVMKKRAKKEQLQLEDKVKQEKPKDIEKKSKFKKGISCLRHIVEKAAPVAAVTSLVASGCALFPYFYDKAADYLSKEVASHNINPEGILATITKVAAGVGGIYLFDKLYKWRIKHRHGPIRKRIYVNGYNWWAQNFSLGNLIRGGYIRFYGPPWIAEKLFYLPLGKRISKKIGKFVRRFTTILPKGYETTKENERFCAEVTVYKEFPSKKTLESVWISYNHNLEPNKKAWKISPETIDNAVERLTDYIKENEKELGEEYIRDGEPVLLRKNLETIANDPYIIRAIMKGKKPKIKKKDVYRILKAMALSSFRKDKSDLLSVDAEKCSKYLNVMGLRGRGKFVRYLEILEGTSKTIVQRAELKEAFRDIKTKSLNEYGEDWAKEGKCIYKMTFVIRRARAEGEAVDFDAADVEEEQPAAADIEEAYEQETPEQEIEIADEEVDDKAEILDSSMAANSLEVWVKKSWRKALDWGIGLKLYYNTQAYDIDMDFFGSGIIGWGRALRRKFYIKDSSGNTVAKMRECKILRKSWPLLDNNWYIDVYDKQLAQDKSFGYILSMATQLLRNVSSYQKNVCEKELKHQAKIEARKVA